MLTPSEEKYLQKIPENKIVQIYPYNSKVKEAVTLIEKRLKDCEIDSELLWIGASALGIAGQNDIDLHILAKPSEWENLAPKVSEAFGERIPNISIHKWEFNIDNFEVELYLSDPDVDSMKTQIRVFEILKNDKNLRDKYEKIKVKCNGIPFREYMRRKYLFFHKVLER